MNRQLSTHCSRDGLKLRLPSSLTIHFIAPGTVVLPSRVPAGHELPSGHRKRDMIKRSPVDWTSRSERTRASKTGLVYLSETEWIRVHMINLSYDGCRLLTDKPLAVGEAMTLVMPNMKHMLVQVRWATDDEAGIRFVQTKSAVENRRARIGV